MHAEDTSLKQEEINELFGLLQQHCADINAQRRERKMDEEYKMSVFCAHNIFTIVNSDDALYDTVINEIIRREYKRIDNYIKDIRLDPENKAHFLLEKFLPHKNVQEFLSLCCFYTNAKRKGTGEPEMRYEHSSRSGGGTVCEVFNPNPVLRELLEEEIRKQGKGPER